jgi:hypothetical protein
MAAVARSHVPRMIMNQTSAKSLFRGCVEGGTLFSRRGSPMMLVAAVPPSGVLSDIETN